MRVLLAVLLCAATLGCASGQRRADPVETVLLAAKACASACVPGTLPEMRLALDAYGTLTVNCECREIGD